MTLTQCDALELGFLPKNKHTEETLQISQYYQGRIHLFKFLGHTLRGRKLIHFTIQQIKIIKLLH